MQKFSYGFLILSFCFTAGGTIGGWALTNKLAGDHAGNAFLHFGAGVVLSLVFMQTIFYFLSRNRVLHQLWFAISIGLSLSWFMLCLLLPLFWIEAINDNIKISIVFFLLLLCICNAAKAFRLFNRKWAKKGQDNFAQHYNGKLNTIDWEKVVRPMKFSAELYVPWLPERATPVLSVAIVFFMLLGLGLRNAFPIFSIFAWGIPSAIIISIFVQMIGFGLAQVVKIGELEKSIGNKIRPKARSLEQPEVGQ